MYRMQTEVRNINYGAMRFYYAIGWGVPAIITGTHTHTHTHTHTLIHMKWHIHMYAVHI